MKPFETSPRFSTQFPNPEDLKLVLLSADRMVREAIARQWLTEGVPRAFENCPGVYEDIRGWLARRIGVHAKEITLVGSARTGYSFATFGRLFDEKSDLDLCVVSGGLFDMYRIAFERFAHELSTDAIRPRSEQEGIFWKENIKFGERNIPNGFFDANKLPTLDRYAIAQTVQQSMYLLKEKLEITPGAPRVRSASIRVYRDWNSAIQRLTLNLRLLF